MQESFRRLDRSAAASLSHAETALAAHLRFLFGNLDLSSDDIDTSDLFRNCVLDLTVERR